MAASPAPQPDREGPSTLTEWLRGRDDRQLARLLRLRPDLALPAASDLAALAGRLGVRTSVQRAVDTLDAFALSELERLVLAADPDGTLDPDVAPDPAAVPPLLDRALVWGDPLRLAPNVAEALGPYPAGLGRPAARLFDAVPDARLTPVLHRLGLPAVPQPQAGQAIAARLADPRRIAAELAGLDADERSTLEALAAGPPAAPVRVAAPAADGRPVPALRLVARGLLAPLDAHRVELPRELGQALRAAAGERSRPEAAEPPLLRVIERDPAELDAIGGTAVLEALRLAATLADSWSAHPPAVLRAGGLGVRDLRRTARDLDVDEATAALLAETLTAAGLLNSTNTPQPVFLPTPEYDRWRDRPVPHRWRVLAEAWLGMTRQPSLAGQRGDRDRVITALGPDAERGTMPVLRRQVLGLLTAELDPGAAPAAVTDVLDRLAWQQPRRASAQRGLVQALLAEADTLGVTAASGPPGYTRTLLDGSGAAAEHALDRALPAPVDHVLVQPDLTVVVPGPPQPALGAELALVADLESTGGASVYRITERSVRRALDAGRSAAQLSAFVTAHSRTPVPQALAYLIEDAARRHGALRTGTASAYLRCDDEALLARVLADRGVDALGLRLIAPTVLVSAAPVTEVLERLRDAGYAPAAESASGELVTLDAEPPRAPERRPARPAATRTVTDSDVQLAQLVRRLRDGDALATAPTLLHPVAASVPGVTSAATMETLRAAVREDRTVVFGHAGPDGRTSTHELRPISLAAGTLRGYEPGRAGLASYPVHRITAVRIVDDADADDDG